MFCSKCGSEITNGADCENCGTKAAGQQINQEQPIFTYSQPVDNRKSKLAAGLLGIFLGGLGIHNFYLGFTNRGLTQILVSLVGGVLTCGVATIAVDIWALVEAIQIFTGSINVDADGIPLKD